MRFAVFVSGEIIIVNYISRCPHCTDDFRYDSAVFRSIDGKFTYLICPCCRCSSAKKLIVSPSFVKSVYAAQAAPALRVEKHYVGNVRHDYAAVYISVNNTSFSDIDCTV